MALTSEEEYLREEALKFAHEVQKTGALEPRSQETQTLDANAGQKVFSDDEAGKEEAIKFLKRVRDRFAASDTDNTFAKFLAAFTANARGQLRRSQLYIKHYILLIGHADLFLEFEGFMNNGREETRLEIENLRVRIRQDFVREIEAALRHYWSTIERLEEIQKRQETPGKITGLHMECIKRAYFSEPDDENDQDVKWQIMLALLANPRRYCHLVLPCLKLRHKVLRRMYGFVLAYFHQVCSQPVLF